MHLQYLFGKPDYWVSVQNKPLHQRLMKQQNRVNRIILNHYYGFDDGINDSL
jgi:hypothetical protein